MDGYIASDVGLESGTHATVAKAYDNFPIFILFDADI